MMTSAYNIDQHYSMQTADFKMTLIHYLTSIKKVNEVRAIGNLL